MKSLLKQVPSKSKVSFLLAAATCVTTALTYVDTALADVNPPVAAPVTFKTSVINRAITESEVLAAQKAWGDALVAISTTYEQKGIEAARALAEKVIDQAYAYQFVPV
ncbi:MAG: hypothetical protein ACKO24_15255, partial [Leptolyngbyaceae cyanobacterium]